MNPLDLVKECVISQRGFLTDPSIENRGSYWLAPLECILNIVRALRMGSCLSAESRSPLPGSPLSPAVGVRKRKSSKKRFGSRNSSFEYRRDEPLHRIPGRMFLNGSSEVASMFTQQGKKGTNQDAMIVWEVSSFSSSPAQQTISGQIFGCLVRVRFIYVDSLVSWQTNY